MQRCKCDKMNKIIRLVNFGKPLRQYLPKYIFFTLLGIIFGLINFTMLIPILRILFGQESLIDAPATQPVFSFSVSYFADLFSFWVSSIIQKQGKLNALFAICILIVISIVIANIFRYLAVRVLMHLRLKVLENIRNELYSKLTNQSLSYYHKVQKGEMISTITNEVQEIENTVINSLQVWLKDPFIVVIYFAVLFYLSPSLTIFTILFLPLSGLIISYITKKLKRIGWFNQNLYGKIMSFTDESLTGIKIIQSYVAEKAMLERFKTLNNEFSLTSKKMFAKRELATPVSEVLGVLVVVGIVMYGGYLLLNGQSALDGSQFISYLLLYSQIIQPLKNISNTTTNIQRGILAAEKIFSVLDEPILINDAENALVKEHFTTGIEIKNLSFKYANKPVIKNISLQIPKGKIIALVGESGSGKSTLTDLLQRFYDPQEGGIFIDGVDIKQLKLSSLRKLVANVSQDAILFNDTVKNNIIFNDVDVNADKLLHAATVANARKFIDQMESGFDSMVGDRGMKLSGGQRQRITIARAIYKDAPILILDEATSALDTESERAVQDAINKAMENRTCLIIAHRLSTIMHADEIIVLKEGEIIERGNHESLLKQNGTYKRLVELQEIK